jgi:hypothetical protein
LIDQTGHSSKLIQIKDRNNALINPSQDVVQICQEAERVFQSYNVFLPNIKNKMINEIKRNIHQRTIFQGLNDHSGQQLFNTHRDQVIALIIIKFLNLRFHHAASIKEKKKCGSMQKKYTKLILFRNE